MSFKFLNVTTDVFEARFSGESSNGSGAKLPNNAWQIFQFVALTSCRDVGRNLQELVVSLIHDRDTAFGATGAALLKRCSIVEDLVRRKF